MEFLIEYLELLKVGYWPPRPDGYAEDIVTGQRKRAAYFETPCQYAAEVEMRLEMTGRDGDLCMLRYHSKMMEEKITRLMNCDVGEIIHRINRAMRYMSGFGRKRISYQEFISHRRRK